MTKKKVVCKVIHSESRSSLSMRNPNRYCIHYYPNTIVKSIKGTVGIMCFETKGYAKIFIKYQSIWLDSKLEIIDVRPIGKANYPQIVSVQTAEGALNNFYKHKLPITMHMHPPKGTICYKSVEVLN